MELEEKFEYILKEVKKIGIVLKATQNERDTQAKELKQLREELQDLKSEGCKYDDIIRENTKLKERVSELKTFEVDFDGSLKMLVEVRNNELTFKAAVNGFGQLVELDKIKITKND
jgi:hypothetical protein